MCGAWLSVCRLPFCVLDDRCKAMLLRVVALFCVVVVMWFVFEIVLSG